ncbi:TPA: thioredoxin domain-containing protein [Candidatus Micrarchaeota archaeon]|nr:MAG: hypothetical protein AUJ65_01780 [Candidatus Micrarchaeota archaeon CG1_02_51_15]HII39179.1 thioredoxin domain-containing protein [Candidatus Micrarchaeota archaeon]
MGEEQHGQPEHPYHEEHRHHEHAAHEHKPEHAAAPTPLPLDNKLLFYAAVALIGGLLIGFAGHALLNPVQPAIAANSTASLSTPSTVPLQGQLSGQAAGEKAVKYLNENLLAAQGVTAVLNSVTEENGLYKLDMSINKGNETLQKPEAYASQNGRLLLVGTTFDLDKPVPTPEPAKPAATPQKTDKPVVELFVMSFCPFGVQAEQAMDPVIPLLKDSADIKIRYIAHIGDTLDSVQSLHGPTEGTEDIRQLCVAKNYNTTVLWNYVRTINAECYPQYSNPEAYTTCWKSAAAKAGINATAMEACITSEGVSLIKTEMEVTAKYGVSGSPTLMINGVRYEGARSADAFKQGICAAFKTPPAACSQAVSSAAPAAAGNC